jgi:hypothetical protein
MLLKKETIGVFLLLLKNYDVNAMQELRCQRRAGIFAAATEERNHRRRAPQGRDYRNTLGLSRDFLLHALNRDSFDLTIKDLREELKMNNLLTIRSRR